MKIVNSGCESIAMLMNFTGNPKHYDYWISGENGEPLAYKERDCDWVIFDAPKALTQLFKSIHELSSK